MHRTHYSSIPALLIAVTGYLHATRQILVGPVAYEECSGNAPGTVVSRLIFKPVLVGALPLTPTVVATITRHGDQVTDLSVILAPSGLPAMLTPMLHGAMERDLAIVLQQMACQPHSNHHPCSPHGQTAPAT